MNDSAPFPRPPRADDAAPDSPTENTDNDMGVFALIKLAFAQGKQLILNEVALAKLKLKAAAARIGMGAALVAVASILCFYLLFWLLRTVEMAFALFAPAWLASLLTAAVILLLLVLLLLVGVLLIRRGSKVAGGVAADVKSDVEELKESFQQ